MGGVVVVTGAAVTGRCGGARIIDGADRGERKGSCRVGQDELGSGAEERNAIVTRR